MRTILLLALACVVLSHKVIHEVDLNDPLFLNSNGTHTVHMIEDHHLRVVVNENPTTGFIWHHNVEDKKGNVVKAKWDSFRIDRYTLEKMQGSVGIGGVRVMHFEAEKPGNFTIEFALARPWEFRGFGNLSESNHIMHHKLHVVVEEDDE